MFTISLVLLVILKKKKNPIALNAEKGYFNRINLGYIPVVSQEATQKRKGPLTQEKNTSQILQ